MYLPCIKCSAEIAPVELLRRGRFAWPEIQVFYSTCPLCTQKLLVRVESNSMKFIKILSPTSQQWDILRSVQVEGLSFHANQELFYCLLEGIVYEYESRPL